MTRSIRAALVWRATGCIAASVVVAVSLIVVSGCGQKDPLLGKWTGTIAGVTNTYEFQPEGVLTQTVTMPGSGQLMTMSGNYTAVDGNLTESFTGMSIDGKTMAAPAGKKTIITVQYRLDGDSLFIKQQGRAQELQLTRSN